MNSASTRPRSESTSSVSAQLGLSLLSLSDIASKQQQIPVPPTSPGLPPAGLGSTAAATTKDTKHRRLGSIGQSRRRLSDARDAAVRPSIAQLATSPPTQQSTPTPAKALGMLSKSVPMDSAFPASMTQAYTNQSAAEETSASTPTGRGKSVGASSVAGDSATTGQTTTTSGPKKKGTIFRCESCSKVYRHPSCLVKHRWEHSPQWREASKFLLSKHQQVQLLEAAAILSHLSPGTSLPEDRSLWPSYLSGGLLPTPEPIAIPNTRSAGVGALAALGGSSSSSSAFATRQHATIDSNGWGADAGRHQGTASSLPSSSPPFAPLGVTGRTRGRSMSSQSGPVLDSRSKARQSQSVSTRSVADSISELGENDDLEMEMEMGIADDEIEVKTEEEVETRLGRGMRTRAWSGRMTGKTMTPTRKDTLVPGSKAKLRRDDRGMSVDKDQEGDSDNEETSESEVEELRNPYLQGSYPLSQQVGTSPHINSVAVPGIGIVVGNGSGHGQSHALPIPGRTSQDAWNVTRDHAGSYSSSFSPSPHSHQGSLPAHANYQFSHSDSPPLSSSFHSNYAHYVHSDSRSAKLHYDPSSSLSLSSYEPSLSTSLSSSVGLPRSSVRGGLEDDEDEAEKLHDEEYGIAHRHGVHHVHAEENGDSWSAMELEMDF